MDFNVASPDWGIWIIAYFYLGGIAAGAYFIGILIEWFGREEDHALVRIAYLIAFPLVLLCTLFLIVDLYRPERFWHMMLKSEVIKEALAEGFPFTSAGWGHAVHGLMFKYWSPMSAGSWGLAVFGACSFASFLSAMWPKGWPGQLLHRKWPHLILQIIGSFCGFFVASYTGALLGASNQRLWSDTTWLAPLFLASAASTSLATLALIAWWKNIGTEAARGRLNATEPMMLGLEMLVIGLFAISLGSILLPVLSTVHGEIMIVGTLVVGVLTPLVLHGLAGRRRWGVPVTAACVLLGGLLLRYGVVTIARELLTRGPAIESIAGAPKAGSSDDVGTPDLAGLGPEINRQPGQPGADVNNRRGPDFLPRTKLPIDEPPKP
jgi:formate-dependent nitrite reductase membrane component NrfD